MTPEPESVAVRVDAGTRRGTGHLIRCLTLAARLKVRGAAVTFVTCPLPAPLAERIAAAGHGHAEIHETESSTEGARGGADQAADAAATLAVLGAGVELLVVDHYGLDATWHDEVRRAVGRLCVIDDLADRPLGADVLVDQNWFGAGTGGRYAGRVPAAAVQLLGPRYALLQPEFARLRGDGRAGDGPLLVSFGGSDPTGETRKVLAALDGPSFADVPVEVVMGGAAPDLPEVHAAVAARPKVRLHRDLPTLAPLMARAGLAVGAGGTTTWERVCLGLPSLVTVVADNQLEAGRLLDEAGIAVLVGTADATDAALYREVLASALRDGLATPPPLVDGHGAERVAEALLPSARPELGVRPAVPADAPAFLGRDATATDDGYLAGPVWWATRLERFDGALREGRAWVVERGEVPVAAAVRDRATGVVELRVDGGIAEGPVRARLGTIPVADGGSTPPVA